MSEEKHEKTYPVRTLHDFLSELDREWSKFRTGSLVGMIASGVLLVFFVLRFLLLALKRLDVMDTMLLVFVAIFLIYSIYALIGQYRFFNKWERRMGLLLHLEEELMSEKLEE
ncbi:hypothetical protein DRO41_04365 [Candidatus Bathyarchaeota archaeon]|nr:MAG: hypothetical protein DRO41_04365 [Candidatus Bathyarchaeota archaeon]